MTTNTLYYGDNLDILRRYIKDESVDLVYLDPPFKSNQDYNVLFQERNGSRSAAQIKAFEDTWRWDQGAAEAYREIVEKGPERVSQAMQGFRMFLGENDMLAYLAMMAPRLVELRRVLKPTGSIYLHCDPTASHYLKMLMDAVLGPVYFRNEITWKRTHAHGDSRRRFANISDTILFYSKTDDCVFNRQLTPYSQEYKDKYYRHTDPDGRRYQLVSLRSPHPRPNLTYDYKGYKPHPNGWAVSREKMEQLDAEGRLYFPQHRDGAIREKYFLDEMSGVVAGDNWIDILPISAQAKERLGYPTQKPEGLLERIILASSNEGNTVLDPFCGCGTAVVVAQKLNRRWIGIDITHLAITLIKHRLESAFGKGIHSQYEVVGEPQDLTGAQALAQQDRFQFQYWALGLVGARPVEQKKGADRGIDGRLYFHDEADKTKQIIIQVKSGHVGSPDVDNLRGVVEKEGAAIGVLITLEEPTQPMRRDAASADFYLSPGWQRNYPRIQILTVAELLGGKGLEYPPGSGEGLTFQRGPKAKPTGGEQPLPGPI